MFTDQYTRSNFSYNLSFKISYVVPQLETLRERRHFLPYAADPDDCEDPDAMVSFDVVAPFVVSLPLADTQPSATNGANAAQYEKFYLAMRFLQFLGVDVTEVEQCFFNHLNVHNYHMISFDNSQLEDLTSLFSCDILSVCGEYTKVLDLLPIVGPSLDDPNCEHFFRFVCNVIERSMPEFTDEYSGYLAVLYIRVLIQRYKAFQKINMKSQDLSKIEKSLGKLAKKILKRDKFRSNLMVYREYGALEDCFGNFMEAEKVYITGLLLICDGTDSFDSDPVVFQQVSTVVMSYIHLHLTAATAYVGAGSEVHTSSIASVICSLVNDGCLKNAETTPVQPANMLRARRKLAEMHDLSLDKYMLSKKVNVWNDLMITVLTSYLALIQYFTVGIKAFCLIFEETISKIKNCKTIQKESASSDGVETSSGNKNDSVSSEMSVTLLRNLSERYAWLLAMLQRLPGGAITPLQRRECTQAALQLAPDSALLLAIMAKLQVSREVISVKVS